MQKNTEKQNKDNEDQSKKADNKKFTLAIDYSIFQKNFISSNKKEKAQKNANTINNNEKPLEEKIKSLPQTQKNLDQFLNISGILDDSQSSLLGIDNKSSIDIKENELNQKINRSIESNKINKNFINDYLDDISINDTEQNLLLSVNYKNLIKSNINNNKTIKANNKKIENTFDEIKSKKYKNNLNTSKKKNKYLKFLIKADKKKYYNFSCGKNISTSGLNKKEKIYALMIKNTNKNANNININKEIKNENNFKDNNSFNLFNDINHKHNMSNYSEISYNALSTATGDINENPKTRNKRNIRSKINSQKNKGNIAKSHFNKKYNLHSYNKNNSYELVEDNFKNKKTNKKNNNNLIIKSEEKRNNFEKNTIKFNKPSSKTISVEKNNNKNIHKNGEVMNLLDDIRNKYQNQEHKYMNQQKKMKNEIKILKEKLKTLSAKEALYQVELEKLKLNKGIQNNTKQKINAKKFVSENAQNIFGQKLDDLIQKYSQNKDTVNGYINMHLLEIFDLDKDILEGENIFDEKDNYNYEEIFNSYPILKKFIQMLVKKYKNEKEYRKRLEEKTIEIFMNDIKRINYLEKKIKKIEHEKKFRLNSSLNYSYDNDLSEGNISNNSCKSFDKSL